jgi:hypothetical protein
MIDIIWIIPAAAVTAALIFTYFIGVEVGVDRGRRQERARRRHPAGKAMPKKHSNVRFITFNNK